MTRLWPFNPRFPPSQRVGTVVGGSRVQFIEKVAYVPVANKTVETQQVQFTDEVVDVTTVKQRLVPFMQTAQKTPDVPQVRDRIVEVSRAIPQERVKPAGERTSLRERFKRCETKESMKRTSTEVLRAVPCDSQKEDVESQGCLGLTEHLAEAASAEITSRRSSCTSRASNARPQLRSAR